MNNTLLTTRKTGRMTCVWVPTGNPRTPLACVWKDADFKVEPSPTNEAGVFRLSA
jgi:hypothetical protein